MSADTILRVPVHYDFASTLCYVAHRVFERIAPELADLGVELDWSPIDLAGLMNWARGHRVSDERRENAARVSRELEVPVTSPPTHWIDSSAALAMTLRIESRALAASWRERVWTDVYEVGHHALPERCPALARELGVEISHEELETGLAELEANTFAAADAEVAGVPTLMLRGFPIAGIQSDATMLSMLGRYASRTRTAEASKAAPS